MSGKGKGGGRGKGSPEVEVDPTRPALSPYIVGRESPYADTCDKENPRAMGVHAGSSCIPVKATAFGTKDNALLSERAAETKPPTMEEIAAAAAAGNVCSSGLRQGG